MKVRKFEKETDGFLSVCLRERHADRISQKIASAAQLRCVTCGWTVGKGKKSFYSIRSQLGGESSVSVAKDLSGHESLFCLHELRNLQFKNTSGTSIRAVQLGGSPKDISPKLCWPAPKPGPVIAAGGRRGDTTERSCWGSDTHSPGHSCLMDYFNEFPLKQSWSQKTTMSYSHGAHPGPVCLERGKETAREKERER